MDTVISQTLMKISDLQTGLEYLSRLPLANPQQAHIELKHFLDSLLKAPPEVDVYLELLEQSRPTLCFVEEELARNYVNKPLPLGAVEEDCFRQVTVVWIKMARSYARCATLVTSVKGHETPSKVALILHRCIYYSGMALVEHHRARRELPPGLWLDLHSYYASAERRGVATLAVPDALDPLERGTHCTAAYLCYLLSELASPYSLSVTDQNLVRRWASIWSPLVSLHSLRSDEALPSSVIDLTQNVGLCSTANRRQTESLRRLDTSRLAAHLSQIRQQLSQKVSPAKIGLGEGCTARQCRRLLRQLVHPWSQARAPRKFQRRSASGEVKLGIGFEAAYFSVSGQRFTQPKNRHPDAPLEFESASEVAEEARQAEMDRAQADLESDQWKIVNQSANGFRLTCKSVRKPLVYGASLAVCPHDAMRYLLAQVVWLMQMRAGGVIAGVVVLPGIPQAVAARSVAREELRETAFSSAFILQPSALSGTETSLVLPRGWYGADSVIEVSADSLRRVKLTRLVCQGQDFDQVSFVVE